MYILIAFTLLTTILLIEQLAIITHCTQHNTNETKS